MKKIILILPLLFVLATGCSGKKSGGNAGGNPGTPDPDTGSSTDPNNPPPDPNPPTPPAPAPKPLAIGTSDALSAFLNQPYTTPLTATGSSDHYMWTTQGSVPDSFHLKSDGAVSWTPTNEDPLTVTVQVADANDSGKKVSKSLTFKVTDPISIQADGWDGMSYINGLTKVVQNPVGVVKLQVTGGDTNYTWSLDQIDGNPPSSNSQFQLKPDATDTNHKTEFLISINADSSSHNLLISVKNSYGESQSISLQLSVNTTPPAGQGGTECSVPLGVQALNDVKTIEAKMDYRPADPDRDEPEAEFLSMGNPNSRDGKDAITGYVGQAVNIALTLSGGKNPAILEKSFAVANDAKAEEIKNWSLQPIPLAPLSYLLKTTNALEGNHSRTLSFTIVDAACNQQRDVVIYLNVEKYSHPALAHMIELKEIWLSFDASHTNDCSEMGVALYKGEVEVGHTGRFNIESDRRHSHKKKDLFITPLNSGDSIVDIDHVRISLLDGMYGNGHICPVGYYAGSKMSIEKLEVQIVGSDWYTECNFGREIIVKGGKEVDCDINKDSWHLRLHPGNPNQL